jgi:hypothetical protein
VQPTRRAQGSRRALDRRIALIIWAIAALVVFGALARSPEPDPLIAVRDPQAARDAIALMHAGEHATYVAEYAFTRADAASRRFTATQYEARAPSGVLIRDGATLTIDWKGQGFDCVLADGKTGCLSRAVATGLPESEVLHVAVDDGFYDVTSAADATIAGEAARCFVIRAHQLNKQLPNDFGAETDACFDAQGVPLRTRRYTDQLDAREAVHVDHRFEAATLRPLLAGFDQTVPHIAQ